MKLSQRMEDMKAEFLRYGFIGSPLSDGQLVELDKENFSPNEIYGIGCDVNAGVSFQRSKEAALRGREANAVL